MTARTYSFYAMQPSGRTVWELLNPRQTVQTMSLHDFAASLAPDAQRIRDEPNASNPRQAIYLHHNNPQQTGPEDIHSLCTNTERLMLRARPWGTCADRASYG